MDIFLLHTFLGSINHPNDTGEQLMKDNIWELNELKNKNTLLSQRANSAEKILKIIQEPGHRQFNPTDISKHFATFKPENKLRKMWGELDRKYREGLNSFEQCFDVAESLGIFNHRVIEALDKLISQDCATYHISSLVDLKKEYGGSE